MQNEADELDELKREMEMPIEDLLSSLPAEVLERPAELKSPTTSDESATEDEEGTTSDKKKPSQKVSRIIFTRFYSLPLVLNGSCWQRSRSDSTGFDAGAEMSTDDEETMDQEEEFAHAEGESRRTRQQEIAELEAEGELATGLDLPSY